MFLSSLYVSTCFIIDDGHTIFCEDDSVHPEEASPRVRKILLFFDDRTRRGLKIRSYFFAVQKFEKMFSHRFHGIIGLQSIIHPLDDRLKVWLNVLAQSVNEIEDPVNEFSSSPLLQVDLLRGCKGKL